MNNLLLFFALPVATILLAIVFQRILYSPILVAITFFAIYLVVTFAAFDETFLIYAILYTILAYITAAITRFISRFIACQRSGNNNNNNDDDDEEDDDNSSCNCENICNCLMDTNNSRGNYTRRYWR